MIEFIPKQYYYDIFLYFSLFLVIVNLIHAHAVDISSSKNIKFIRTSGILFLVLVVFYLGLRPISARTFGDMDTYANYFYNYSRGEPVTTKKDIFFHYFTKTLSGIVGVHGFFLIVCFLYIFPMYLLCKKYFERYWFYAFFMFLVSFSFYSYGVNGIRNGMATSMFLLALCYANNKKLAIFFSVLAFLFHKTMLLPIFAYIITLFFNNPKIYLKSWLVSIPLSLFFGSIFVSLFTSLGFGDDRLSEYLTGEANGGQFRWDFLFYSSFPILSGWYFIFKKKFKDEFYYQIFNTYLICNAFWVLVIRANFSNRFAYLSWFLMAFIIIYPLLRKVMFKNQQVVIAKVLFAYFLFTFFMSFLYYAK